MCQKQHQELKVMASGGGSVSVGELCGRREGDEQRKSIALSTVEATRDMELVRNTMASFANRRTKF